jgi:hypothetical protein
VHPCAESGDISQRRLHLGTCASVGDWLAKKRTHASLPQHSSELQA